MILENFWWTKWKWYFWSLTSSIIIHNSTELEKESKIAIETSISNDLVPWFRTVMQRRFFSIIPHHLHSLLISRANLLYMMHCMNKYQCFNIITSIIISDYVQAFPIKLFS